LPALLVAAAAAAIASLPLLSLPGAAAAAPPSPLDLALISFATSGAQNQLWNRDAFPALTQLAPRGRVTLLNVSLGGNGGGGGGVVTSLHVVIAPDGDYSRTAMNEGVFISVVYEDGAGPTFSVPVGAFFGVFFDDTPQSEPNVHNFETSLLARRNTNSLHLRAPMPFARSVLIELVSAVDFTVGGYSIATYETRGAIAAPAGGAVGYLMATHSAQSSPDWPFEATRILPEPVAGAGHVVHVAYSATTARSDLMTVADHFNGVCEGNVEFFLDNSTVLPGNSSDPALLSWLGSEDFFGQSYGWTLENSERAGTTYIDGIFPDPIRMATYRDLSDAPIRFAKSVAAWIEWEWDHARVPKECLAARGSCAVNFTVTTLMYLLANATAA
jgi:hypothetical protein